MLFDDVNLGWICTDIKWVKGTAQYRTTNIAFESYTLIAPSYHTSLNSLYPEVFRRHLTAPIAGPPTFQHKYRLYTS